MTSPSDRPLPRPGLVFVPPLPVTRLFPTPTSSPAPDRARPEPAAVAHHFRDLHFRRCLDRAAACIATGRDDRARQWINEAALGEGLDLPWADLGRITHADQPD